MRSTAIAVIPIPTPFINIASHVIKTITISRKRPYRTGVRFPPRLVVGIPPTGGAHLITVNSHTVIVRLV